MPHKDKERFRAVDLGTTTGFTVIDLPTGAGKLVTGVCPRCDDTTTFTFRKGTASGGTTKGLGAALRRSAASKDADATPDIGVATVWCQCGYSHDGRPDDVDEDGCGAYWMVQLRPPVDHQATRG